MKIFQQFKSEEAKNVYKRIADWIGGATIGAIISTILTNNYIWTAVFFSLLVIILTYYIVLSYRTKSKCDIVNIMKVELKAGNWMQVIRLGYPLSRPLHLSGRNSLRHELGELIKQACDHLPDDKTIRINDENLVVEYIKAKTLIDDLGWTAYQLNNLDLAQDKISEGIEVAKNINANNINSITLAIKGYRHLIGIFDSVSNYSGRDQAEKEARILLESKEYRESFKDQNEYIHTIAEFNYAYAKTLIDDDPEKALQIAQSVQEVFSSEATSDMDRYVKTFDLIGDIYANYNRPEKLKEAKKTYLLGINECEHYGRSERLIRISIDYIDLLIKMIDIDNVYSDTTWEKLDDEELTVYTKAFEYATRAENKEYLFMLKKEHKKYLKRRRDK